MSNTDSDFFPESDTTSNCSNDSILLVTMIENEADVEYSDSDSDSDEDSVLSCATITPDDYAELTITAYVMMDEYTDTNILSMSSPSFYTKMVTHITELLYTDMNSSYTNEYDNDSVDTHMMNELHDFVEQTLEVWKGITHIPPRSIIQHESEIVERTFNETNNLKCKIAELIRAQQPSQRTSDWYNARYQLITASNLWKVFGSQSQINSLIYEKCKPLELTIHEPSNIYTEGPMQWGVKYEPVTIQIYEKMYDTSVGEFGCITHPKYPYIGASPDGINIRPGNKLYSRMLEIKNIVNREITGIPKEEYWIQTQIQMETCDLDECDFVETRIKEYETEDAFYQDCEHEYRGIVLHFITRPPTVITVDTKLSNTPSYVYMPLSVPLDKHSVEFWTDEQRKNMIPENKVLFARNYWYLDQISCVLIQRNREWFATAVPIIQQVWDTIVKERVEGYEHRASKKRIPKERAMSILGEDGTVSIPDKTFCLIRLDENGNVL